MLRTCKPSCVLAYDVKIVRSSDAQYKTKQYKVRQKCSAVLPVVIFGQFSLFGMW